MSVPLNFIKHQIQRKLFFEKVVYDIRREETLEIGIAHRGDRLHMDLIQLRQYPDND